jgi:hypothetical protein
MKQSWIFRWWFVAKLQQQMSSPFKIKNEVDAVKSDCLVEIQSKIEPLWLSVKRLSFQIGIKTIQNNRARLTRNEINQHSVIPNPAFSQNQISKIIRKYWFNLCVIFFFVLSESFLYWLTASLFVPGGSEIIKASVAVFLAFLIMVSLNYGFTQHFMCRKLRYHYRKNEVTEYEIGKQKDTRFLGYILITLSFAAIIFSGLARIFFLENIPSTGLSPEKYKSVLLASKWASVLTMVVTVITAVVLGLIKREQSAVAEQYDVLSYWKRAIKKRNTYSKELIKDAGKILSIIEHTAEQHWQLIIDLKRIFKAEYDEKYEQLHQEYIEIKNKPGFTLNDNLYRKFSPIQGAHEELFRYGIYNNSELREKLSLVQGMIKSTEEYLAEHINAVNSQSQINTEKHPVPLNDKQKETIHSHT